MNKYLTMALLGAGLTLSTSGFAANADAVHHGPDRQAVFKALDSNGDNQLTAAEMARLPEVMRQQHFDRLDSNGDGKIDATEFAAPAKARAARLFSKLDSNGDGTLSADELEPPMPPHHGKMEKGHMPPPPPPEQSTREHKRGHYGWYHEKCRHHPHRPGTSDIFARMDVNNDGYVSRKEWDQAAQRMHRQHGPEQPDSHPAPAKH